MRDHFDQHGLSKDGTLKNNFQEAPWGSVASPPPALPLPQFHQITYKLEEYQQSKICQDLITKSVWNSCRVTSLINCINGVIIIP